MGLSFKELVVKKEISVKDLKGKILAIDANNNLYQYLTTIRGPDGTVLIDRKGRVTSHLIGLFNRTTALMEEGLKLVFVFDGKPPEIKQKTWEKRRDVKEEASLRLKEAEEIGDIESMKKFAARTAVLNKEMIEDARNVIRALGLPVIQAPSEGEAQTAYMVKKGDAYASVSQDYDNLIFGCPLLVRNLSIEGKRKKTGKFGFQVIKPELLVLKEVLDNLKLDLDQLIIVAILVGTDYNPGGVKGIGPKKGLKLVQEHKNDFAALFQEVQWEEQYPEIPWQKIFETIKNIPVTDNYTLEWKSLDEKSLLTLLVEEHNFSEERVRSKLEKLRLVRDVQKGLGSYL